MPNWNKIYKVAIKYFQYVPFQGPSKFALFGILGVQIYHLATLREERNLNDVTLENRMMGFATIDFRFFVSFYISVNGKEYYVHT
jgi:hypothetical protein